jgi:hypothetical protein
VHDRVVTGQTSLADASPLLPPSNEVPATSKFEPPANGYGPVDGEWLGLARLIGILNILFRSVLSQVQTTTGSGVKNVESVCVQVIQAVEFSVVRRLPTRFYRDQSMFCRSPEWKPVRHWVKGASPCFVAVLKGSQSATGFLYRTTTVTLHKPFSLKEL